METISISDFRFMPSGYGHFRVTYTNPTTKEVSTTVTDDMPLIDATKNSDEPKTKDLKKLRDVCKGV